MTKLTRSDRRWTFLQAGVEGIMRNLKDGVDMATVSTIRGECCIYLLILESTVYGNLHVSARAVSPVLVLTPL